MPLILTVVVYRCPVCNCDTTFIVHRIKDIRRKKNVQCPYCESKKQYDESRDDEE